MQAPERLGPFRVVRPLGKGGMGTVYEVVDPQLGRRVALKLLHREVEGPAVERFWREAELLARVAHPGVVKVHRTGELPQGPFILEELVEGSPLRDLVAQGPVPPARAAVIARALADALAVVHAAGVVHRDLKPENVVLRADGAPVLIDFGVARDQDAETLTRTGALVGTVAYMAPEQVRSRRGVALDGRADVWALGVVLYEMLAGRPPFDGAPLEALCKVLQEAPPPLAVDVSEELEAIVLVALSKDRDARQSSAAALRDELGRFLAGQPTESGLQLRSRRRRRRAGLAARLTAVMAALGLVGAGAAGLATPSPPPPAAASPRVEDEAAGLAVRALEAGDAVRAEAILAGAPPAPPALAAARASLVARVAVARATGLARGGDVQGAVTRLRRAREADPGAGEAGLLAVCEALLEGWTEGRLDAPLVRRLVALGEAWPGARLSPSAAAPLLALAAARLTAGGDDEVREATELSARARRVDPTRTTPPGLQVAVGGLFIKDLAEGRHVQAARLLVLGCELGGFDPVGVPEDHTLPLARAGAFEAVLAAEGASPYAALWAGIGAEDLAHSEPFGHRIREQEGQRAVALLAAARLALPPHLAAEAAGHQLRAEAATAPAPEGIRARALELEAAHGEHGWRVARQAARLLRHLSTEALPFARRALDGATAAAADPPVLERAREALIGAQIDVDELDEPHRRPR